MRGKKEATYGWFLMYHPLTTASSMGYMSTESFRKGEDTGKLSCLLGPATNT